MSIDSDDKEICRKVEEVVRREMDKMSLNNGLQVEAKVHPDPVGLYSPYTKERFFPEPRILCIVSDNELGKCDQFHLHFTDDSENPSLLFQLEKSLSTLSEEERDDLNKIIKTIRKNIRNLSFFRSPRSD